MGRGSQGETTFKSKVSLDIALLLFGGAHTFRIVLGKQELK